MKFIKGRKYLLIKHNIELIFDGHEKNSCWFTCGNCKKEINSPYFFSEKYDDGEIKANYTYGSECVKKVFEEVI